jgi:hypothetical protein
VAIPGESPAKTPTGQSAATYGADMAPQDPRLPQPARKPKITRETIVVAIPALAALALGAMFVMPSVFASATPASHPASVWAGPAIARPAASGSSLIPAAMPTLAQSVL